MSYPSPFPISHPPGRHPPRFNPPFPPPTTCTLFFVIFFRVFFLHLFSIFPCQKLRLSSHCLPNFRFFSVPSAPPPTEILSFQDGLVYPSPFLFLFLVPYHPPSVPRLPLILPQCTLSFVILGTPVRHPLFPPLHLPFSYQYMSRGFCNIPLFVFLFCFRNVHICPGSPPFSPFGYFKTELAFVSILCLLFPFFTPSS